MIGSLSHPHTSSTARAGVRTGADRIVHDAASFLDGRRIGVLTNHTGRLSDGRPLVDAIVQTGLARITALFGPEHGIQGDVHDGAAVDHSIHPRHRIPVYSLYGKTHKPTPEMLRDVDVFVCDIQDVGARFYTFVSTIALAQEACAEAGIPFVILDRPNPIRGIEYDGPVRDPSLRSFVGWMPIPVTHGMTIGELARLWNGEGWLANGVRGKIDVIRMEGWTRSQWYDETGLPWISPSPNMRTIDTATVYPGTCFIEGTAAAEGRGTNAPFELIGAPWMNADAVLDQFSQFAVPGVSLAAERFTPRDIPGVAGNPKFADQDCRGIRITVTDREILRPVRLGIALIAAIKRVHPAEMELRHRRFDILVGSSEVRHQLDRNVDPGDVCARWSGALEAFGEIRSRYLLYS